MVGEYTDVGLTGPDQDKGGKYLLVPPGYGGSLPSDGYFVTKTPTNSNRVFCRAFVQGGDIAAAVRGVKANADDSVTVWFGPKAPAGEEGNWVQTWPGKGWNTLLRLYGPLEPWFDKTWKPGDFERVD